MRQVIGLVLAANVIIGTSAIAQDEHVFLVQTDSRSLTGFRVEGYVGIFTALHGVLEAKEITVRSNDPNLILTRPVTIARANIESDLAILVSDEIAKLPKNGIRPPRIADLSQLKGQHVKVVGHPIGITAEPITTTLEVRDRPIARLGAITPAAVANELQLRGSPSPTLSVLSLQGDLLPGHSGAPILDQSNSIVAVANGGLKGGTVGHGWAVPFASGRWEDVATARPKLDALRKRQATNLFVVADPGVDPNRITLEATVEPKEAILIVTCEGVPCNDNDVTISVDGPKHLIRILPKEGKKYAIEAWYDQGKWEPFAQNIDAAKGEWKAIRVTLQAANVPMNVFRIEEWQKRYKELGKKFYPDKEYPKTNLDKLREFKPSGDRSKPADKPRTKPPSVLRGKL